MEFTSYTPNNWFWIVAGDTSRAWSSAATAYVSQWDETRLTRIASEAELRDVLRVYGIQGPSPTTDDYGAAIQAHIEATAKARGYLDAVTCASYAASTVPRWRADAMAFIPWRDAAWSYAYEQLARVEAAQRPQLTVAALIVELPSISWPE